VPPDCHIPASHKKSAELLGSIGYNTKDLRRKVNNRRFRLKFIRENNYSKFYQLCTNLQVTCPEDNSWVKNIVEEDIPSFSPPFSKMPPPAKTKFMSPRQDPDDYEDSVGKLIA
jgi:hypothetical protein